jgi:hypothetical protein
MSKPQPQFLEFREFTFELIRHQQAIAEKLGLNLTDFKAGRVASAGRYDTQESRRGGGNERSGDDDHH